MHLHPQFHCLSVVSMISSFFVRNICGYIGKSILGPYGDLDKSEIILINGP